MQSLRHIVRPTIAALICTLSCVPCLSQPPAKPDPDQAMQTMQKWVALQAAWGTPAAQPVHGSGLEIVEKSREQAPDGHTILHYTFKVTGLPTQATYLMEYWPVGGTTSPFQKVASGLHIDKDGLVICIPSTPCGNKSQPELPLEISIPGAALGDTLRFVFTSEQATAIRVTGLAAPFPVHSADGACQLGIVRLTPEGELLLLTGSGFPANTTLTIKGDSAGEEHVGTALTDAQGNFQSAQLPSVVGKPSGTLTQIISDGAACHPSISADWGAGSHKLQ